MHRSAYLFFLIDEDNESIYNHRKKCTIATHGLWPYKQGVHSTPILGKFSRCL